jgi:hypothetical protein
MEAGMFYRRVTLDPTAENSIEKLEILYNQIQDVMNKIPDSRSKSVAEISLHQSYMWLVSCVEAAVVQAQQEKAEKPSVQPPVPPAPVPPAPVPPAPVPPAPFPPAPVPPFSGLSPNNLGLVPPSSYPNTPKETDADVLCRSKGQIDNIMSEIKTLTESLSTTKLNI